MGIIALIASPILVYLQIYKMCSTVSNKVESPSRDPDLFVLDDSFIK